jgi:hypothetical protein
MGEYNERLISFAGKDKQHRDKASMFEQIRSRIYSKV